MDDQERPSKSTRNNVSSQPNSVAIRIPKRSAKITGVVVLVIVSFLAGMLVEHSQRTTVTNTAVGQPGSGNLQGGFGGRGGFRANGARGSVTAISSTSITVQDSRSGTSKTYSIDSSTTISDNGSTVAASDIAVGDSVIVTTSSGTSTTATRILVNPSFGGAGAPDPGTASPDTSTTN